MVIAGIWREGHGNHPPAFTMLTTAPGADMEQSPDRGAPTRRLGGLDSLTKPEDELLRPLAAGWLVVQTVREGRG